MQAENELSKAQDSFDAIRIAASAADVAARAAVHAITSVQEANATNGDFSFSVDQPMLNPTNNEPMKPVLASIQPREAATHTNVLVTDQLRRSHSPLPPSFPRTPPFQKPNLNTRGPPPQHSSRSLLPSHGFQVRRQCLFVYFVLLLP